MTATNTSSIYAKPLVPRIVLRPALASVLLHGLLLYLLTANWVDSTSRVITAKPAPQVINARLVDASEFRPKPKPKAKPKPKPKAAASVPASNTVSRPKPEATPGSRATARAAAKPTAKPSAKPAPEPAPGRSEPAASRAEPERQRMTPAELAALARADLARAVAEEEGAAGAGGSSAELAATSAEMAATYAALIQQTVINYWSRPPSARNGMETLLSIQLIPTGEVVSVSVTRSSGNTAFDRSAINAVEKAGSFPELQNLPPREFEKSFRRFSLLFRPEDLRY